MCVVLLPVGKTAGGLPHRQCYPLRMAVTVLAPRIVADSSVRSGNPVIEGSRVPVEVVVGQMAAGLNVDQVATEYGITREDVLAALGYAAHVLSTEQVRAVG